MKTEELTALGLSAEQVAAVLASNGRDIERLKAANDTQKAELEAAKTQLAEAGSTIEGFKAMDFEGVKKAAEEWKSKAEQAEKGAAQQLAELQFTTLLDGAIAGVKGKNAKAIKALLDLDGLKASKNQTEELKKALEALQAESGYLFEGEQAPPPYAAGTGTAPLGGGHTKESFAKLGYQERLTLKQTNPTLYENLKG